MGRGRSPLRRGCRRRPRRASSEGVDPHVRLTCLSSVRGERGRVYGRVFCGLRLRNVLFTFICMMAGRRAGLRVLFIFFFYPQGYFLGKVSPLLFVSAPFLMRYCWVGRERERKHVGFLGQLVCFLLISLFVFGEISLGVLGIILRFKGLGAFERGRRCMEWFVRC